MSEKCEHPVPPPAEQVEPCPVCSSTAIVWDYVNPKKGVARVVMCTNTDSLGPRDSLVYEGCLLAMPPNDFYKQTGREAVKYWNAYAKAVVEYRQSKSVESTKT